MKLLVHLLAWLLLTAACRAEPPAAVLDVWLGERSTTEIEQLVKRAALAPDQDVRVMEIGRDAHTSHHVVAIRSGEELHRHDRHELTVVVLRGHGTLRLGEQTRAIGEGSILYVPRGAVHAFTNGANEPSYAYILYSPPFDGEDRAPAD
jgi:mannose-6-phosphate isomerase-like protein (cupin superfamily)